ncbi:MAG: glycoside hydrolase family 43 protein [Brevundimonas sp.]
MRTRMWIEAFACAAALSCAPAAMAQDAAATGLNPPLTTEIHLADPSAHVFEGRIHVYGSHDIVAPPVDDQPGAGFAMRDYRVLSMATDGGDVRVHPVALALEDVAWADRQLWAPDAARRDGRYFLYFPAKDRDGVFRIGVATGDRPHGPFRPAPAPIPGAFSIDPAVFMDVDGAAYLYFGGIDGGQLQRWTSGAYVEDPAPLAAEAPAAGPRVARLSDDMMGLAGPVREIVILDEAGRPLTAGDRDRRFFEAAWIHRYGGLYYLSYSTGDTHRIVYATSTSPYGPFTWRGVILTPVEGWTTHQSIVEVEGRWRLFYHDAARSGDTVLRDAKWTELVHEADGSIRTIDPSAAP